MVEGTPDGVRLGNTLQGGEQVRTEALHAHGHAIDTEAAQSARELLCHGFRVGLDAELAGRRQRTQEAFERGWFRERRRAAAEEDRLERRREQLPLERQLAQQRVDIRAVLAAASHDGDEVAVAAAVRTEGQMHVEMTRHFFSPSRLSTARKASCGTSTMPTCFMRFLPAFCCSSSLRLRVMSPP